MSRAKPEEPIGQDDIGEGLQNLFEAVDLEWPGTGEQPQDRKLHITATQLSQALTQRAFSNPTFLTRNLSYLAQSAQDRKPLPGRPSFISLCDFIHLSQKVRPYSSPPVDHLSHCLPFTNSRKYLNLDITPTQFDWPVPGAGKLHITIRGTVSSLGKPVGSCEDIVDAPYDKTLNFRARLKYDINFLQLPPDDCMLHVQLSVPSDRDDSKIEWHCNLPLSKNNFSKYFTRPRQTSVAGATSTGTEADSVQGSSGGTASGTPSASGPANGPSSGPLASEPTTNGSEKLVTIGASQNGSQSGAGQNASAHLPSSLTGQSQSAPSSKPSQNGTSGATVPWSSSGVSGVDSKVFRLLPLGIYNVPVISKKSQSKKVVGRLLFSLSWEYGLDPPLDQPSADQSSNHPLGLPKKIIYECGGRKESVEGTPNFPCLFCHSQAPSWKILLTHLLAEHQQFVFKFTELQYRIEVALRRVPTAPFLCGLTPQAALIHAVTENVFGPLADRPDSDFTFLRGSERLRTVYINWLVKLGALEWESNLVITSDDTKHGPRKKKLSEVDMLTMAAAFGSPPKSRRMTRRRDWDFDTEAAVSASVISASLASALPKILEHPKEKEIVLPAPATAVIPTIPQLSPIPLTGIKKGKHKERRLGHQFYHSSTLSPIDPRHLHWDSDEQCDEEWLLWQNDRALADFDDVSISEQSFLRVWNKWMHANTCYGDYVFPKKCQMFAEQCGRELLSKHLRIQFLTHLLSMWEWQLVDVDCIEKCMALVDQRATVRTATSASPAM